MCGIVGAVSPSPVNQTLYDGLLLLQHRGQDAAGIATATMNVMGNTFAMHKGQGHVRDVFRTRNMRSLPGLSGIGQVRYPTAGSASNTEEAQPLYVNAPFGIILAHNGNLTNAALLKAEMFSVDRRHINTNSDSEVLLNVFAHELDRACAGASVEADHVFAAVSAVHARCKGSYAVIVQIAGFGLVAFRDPFGIRPLCFGKRSHNDWLVASESVVLEALGYTFVRDLAPGEALVIDLAGNGYSRHCAPHAVLTPCMFEYVYFARPDSILDGVSVYDARLKMGEHLALKVAREIPSGAIDVVMPIPDSARPSAMQLALKLNVPYREGFIKNRYVGRTFIMPGQAVRKKSVRQKLNAMHSEFKGKNVLIVDDSIVRGTTSSEIVQMARDAGAKSVIFASAASAVKFPNVYGIDMPTRNELVAHNRTVEEVAYEIGCDKLIYQDQAAMQASIREINPALTQFEASCFDGHYVTGDITPEYLDKLERARLLAPGNNEEVWRSQLNLQQGLEF